MRHFTFNSGYLQVTEGIGKDILNECGCVNALFAERFTNIPSKVHYINAFKL